MAAEKRSIPAIVTTDLSSMSNVGQVGDDQQHSNVDSERDGVENEQTTTTSGSGNLSASSPPPNTIHNSLFPSTPAGHSHRDHHHARTPSDPHFLAPTASPQRPSPTLQVPSSPYSPNPDSPSPSTSIGTGTWFPPSPTLSTRSSVHFVQPTTLALRDNQVDGKSGMDSLQLLGVGSSSHMRKSSSATSVSFCETEGDNTDPDSHSNIEAETTGLRVPSFQGSRSDGGAISPTVTHVDHEHEEPGAGKKSLHGITITHTPPASTHLSIPDSKTKKDKKDKKSPSPPPPAPADPSEEADPTPFTITPLTLAGLVDPKSLDSLRKLGGVDGVMRALGVQDGKGLCYGAAAGDHEKVSGLSEAVKVDEKEKGKEEKLSFNPSIEDRRRVYGINFVPGRKSKSLLLLMWLALKDRILIMLSIVAVISLALGLFQDFGTPPETITCDDGSQCELPKVDWVEGVAIIIAIIIVDVVGSVNDWQKERQFKALNEKKEDRSVKVIRDGTEKVVNIKDILVGDIALLEPGEIVPVDGLFIRGHGVKCDESGATGESDAVRKVPYESLINADGKMHEHADHADDMGEKGDCFLLSGSKVLEGVGCYVVIAVGVKSFNGRIMLALRSDAEETPLQAKLNYVAELIAKLGTAAGVILFAALMIRFFVQLGTDPNRSASTKALAFVNILIISCTLVVVAVPEGLPLAVTLALAFATKRMTKEQLLVRVLASCETMANASVVCTDKTGTLTQNEMSVVAGSIGIHAKFVRRLEMNPARTNAADESRKHREDFSIDQNDLNSVVSPQLKKLFNDAIAINSTAFEDMVAAPNGEMQKTFVGNKTETALLKFARELGWEDYKGIRTEVENAKRVVQMIPFSSERKAMGVVIRLPENGGKQKWRLYLKGASEILTKKCDRHVVVYQKGAKEQQSGEIETREIDELKKENISRTIIFYANQMLRTIALCYKDLDDFPDNEEEMAYDDLSTGLTLIAITGIEDPLRPGVSEAVANCHKAGVAVKMCTGDNVLTARSIASQCGIFTPGGIVMEGPVFRTLDDHDMKEILPRLQVLARSSPEDKKILVDGLKEMGEIVGVTGDGTNDGPALKRANVGFSMGIAGTEVAKEASDIILMDDNFASIVSAIMWGRCVNDAVRKFLQFQISVNITAVIITFVTAVASATESSVLSAVQLLWINIIMDTFAALALATDPATVALLDRKPDRKTAPLFTVDMCKQVIGQATYQTIIVLIFHFLGPTIFGHDNNASQQQQRREHTALQAFVFNAFVFCQIFNSINCRRLNRKLNVFEGITKNWYFMSITAIEVIIQILVMFFGGAAFQVAPISGLQWGVSLVIGFVALPLGALIRCVPNEPVQKLLVKLRIMSDPLLLPMSDPVREKGEWNAAIDAVRDNLTTFSNVRGGRLRSSSIVRRSRTSKPTEVALPSLMTMVPTIVATSVTGRWGGNGSLSDPAHVDPSRSSAALWEGKIQLHPDTAKDDPAYQRWGGDSSKA